MEEGGYTGQHLSFALCCARECSELIAWSQSWDHMACVQKLSSRAGISTFGDLLAGLEKFIRLGFLEGNIVQVVSDRYDSTLSIKAGERKRRGHTANSPEVCIYSKDQVLPRNMKAYLASPKNKDNLNAFVFSELETLMPCKLDPSQTLVLSGGFVDHERVIALSKDSVKELYDLYSSQEEADTRLMLHIHDACTRFGINTAIIWSPDTDVFILGIHFSGQFDINIWFKTGTKQSTRYIPLHSIGQKIGADLCTLLLPYHALTGCDSTSCFKGKGKKKGLDVLRGNQERYQSLRSLGDSLQIPQEVMKVCENFVCQLYQSDPVTTDINKVRYNLFCKHAKQNEGLPPCRDSLTQHVKRCNYQCVVWKSALVAKPDIPPPGGHGWIGTEDGLLPELMTQESAPKEVVELTTCRCKTSKCAKRQCKCAQRGLKCTPACLCGGDVDQCVNTGDDADESDSVSSDEDSDE